MANQQPRVPTSCPVGFTERYTIVSGDTLFKIAQRYGINVATLVAANPHITNPDLIYPGDVICVPTAPEVPAPEVPAGRELHWPPQQVQLTRVYLSFYFPDSAKQPATRLM